MKRPLLQPAGHRVPGAWLLPLAALLAHPALAQTPAATFAAAATYSTGRSPISPVVADVNGDGKPDLLTANYGAGTVGVLPGTGTGTFGPATAYSTGAISQPFSLKVADVNGDGRPDLLTANFSYGTAGVQLGTSGGGFGAVTTYSTGTDGFPYDLAVADVTGDGKPDLVVTNYGTSVLSVLPGTGTGSFGPVVAYSTGTATHPRGLAVADLNSDGQPDLVTANQFTGAAAVLLGTGGGSFGPVATYSFRTSADTTSLAVADVNSDGRPDLLTANQNAGTAGVQLGTGTGTFEPVATYSTGPGSRPASLAVADVNADGLPDLITANQQGSLVSVLPGIGIGQFGPATTYGSAPGVAIGHFNNLTVADVNGDGLPDLVVTDADGGTASVLLNTTPVILTRTFPATAYGTGAGSAPRGVAVADVNGDGRPDLLTANYGSSSVGVQLGAGAGTFGPATTYGAGGQPFSVAVADVNGDGKPDLLTANPGSNSAAVLAGNGDGTFRTAATYATGSGSYPVALAVADVNGDGRPDLLTANDNSNTAAVLLGTGGGTFGPAATYSTGPGSQPNGLAVADVNGDGKPDLLTANLSSSTVAVLPGTGTGSFGTAATFSTGPASSPQSLAVADVNGDGRPDVLTGNSGSSTVGVLLGAGTGSFGAVTTFSTGPGSTPRAIAVADVNGDGKPDVLTANYGSNSAGVLTGTGTGGFGAVTAYDAGGSQPYAIAVADVNGDGRPDLLTANQGSNSTGVLLSERVVLATQAAQRRPAATLYPNPAPGAALLSGTVPGAAVRVLDALGRTVATATADAGGAAPLPAGLAPGVYVVRAGGTALRWAVE